MPPRQPGKHIAFTAGQRSDTHRRLGRRGGLAVPVPQPIERRFTAPEQRRLIERFVDEINRPLLHPLDGERNVSMAGNYVERQRTTTFINLSPTHNADQPPPEIRHTTTTNPTYTQP